MSKTVVATPDLGLQMFSRAIVLRGRLSVDKWRRFLAECAKAMGMEPAGPPAQWEYPTGGGKGGNGHTIVLPITESFLALDSWPDHDGAYLFIASCRKFTPSQLREPIIRFGLEHEQISDPLVMRLG